MIRNSHEHDVSFETRRNNKANIFYVMGQCEVCGAKSRIWRGNYVPNTEVMEVKILKAMKECRIFISAQKQCFKLSIIDFI